jgi:predicted secreted protein
MPRITTPLAALAALALAFPALADAKTVRKGDSGKTIALTAGQKLVVKLKECGPCGYSWRYGIPPAKAILKRTKSAYVNPDTDPMTVGGPGTRVITYVAKSAGTTKLRLNYYSPSGDKEGSFRLTVKVKAR